MQGNAAFTRAVFETEWKLHPSSGKVIAESLAGQDDVTMLPTNFAAIFLEIDPQHRTKHCWPQCPEDPAAVADASHDHLPEKAGGRGNATVHPRGVLAMIQGEKNSEAKATVRANPTVERKKGEELKHLERGRMVWVLPGQVNLHTGSMWATGWYARVIVLERPEDCASIIKDLQTKGWQDCAKHLADFQKKTGAGMQGWVSVRHLMKPDGLGSNTTSRGHVGYLEAADNVRGTQPSTWGKLVAATLTTGSDGNDYRQLNVMTENNARRGWTDNSTVTQLKEEAHMTPKIAAKMIAVKIAKKGAAMAIDAATGGIGGSVAEKLIGKAGEQGEKIVGLAESLLYNPLMEKQEFEYIPVRAADKLSTFQSIKRTLTSFNVLEFGLEKSFSALVDSLAEVHCALAFVKEVAGLVYLGWVCSTAAGAKHFQEEVAKKVNKLKARILRDINAWRGCAMLARFFFLDDTNLEQFDDYRYCMARADVLDSLLELATRGTKQAQRLDKGGVQEAFAELDEEHHRDGVDSRAIAANKARAHDKEAQVNSAAGRARRFGKAVAGEAVKSGVKIGVKSVDEKYGVTAGVTAAAPIMETSAKAWGQANVVDPAMSLASNCAQLEHGFTEWAEAADFAKGLGLRI